MAVLTPTELTDLRQGCERSANTAGAAQAATKLQINAALQAIEDHTENVAKAGYSGAIETAAAGVFNAGAKKRLVAHYFRQKFLREGV